MCIQFRVQIIIEKQSECVKRDTLSAEHQVLFGYFTRETLAYLLNSLERVR